MACRGSLDPIADLVFGLCGDAWHGGSWGTVAPLAYDPDPTDVARLATGLAGS
jgi:hypothetical protein